MKKSKSQRKAVQKYNAANYDQIIVRVPKGERDTFREFATYHGCSLAEYMRRAAYLASDIAEDVRESPSIDGWEVRIEGDYLTAVCDTGVDEEYEWKVLPLTADRLATIYGIVYEYGPDDSARTNKIMDMMDGARDLIWHDPSLYACAYTNENRDACFDDGLQEYYTTELLDDSRVGIDLDGVHWYFPQGATKPINVKEFITGPSYFVL